MTQFEKLTIKILCLFYHCSENTAKARKREIMQFFDCSPTRLQLRHLCMYEGCTFDEVKAIVG